MAAYPRIAIVGTGPAGFYAAAALLDDDRFPDLAVDFFERLPCPFGLVRGGVAPDHPKTRAVITQFEATLRHPRVRYFGNVTINRDIPLDLLRRQYHAVLISAGADRARTLGIPGEDLPGVLSARAFTGWCCAHPDYANLRVNIECESVVVIGHGNVALDAARLLCRSVDELRRYEIPESVLDVLAASRVRDVYLVGRGGALDMKCTYPELHEMGTLARCQPVVDACDLPVDGSEPPDLARNRAWNLKTLRTYSKKAHDCSDPGQKCCHFRFNMQPTAFCGIECLEAVEFSRNGIDSESIEAGMALVAVGNCVSPWRELPYDTRKQAHESSEGLLLPPTECFAPVYASGWFHRAPTGLIGHNRADSEKVASRLLADLSINAEGVTARDGIADALLAGLRIVDAPLWTRLSDAETERGRSFGKPRERFASHGEYFGFFDHLI